MKNLFAELRRRNVFRVAGVYAVIAWLLVQVVVAIETPLSLPAWTDTFFIVLVLAGFPIALVFAFAVSFIPSGVISNAKAASPRLILLLNALGDYEKPPLIGANWFPAMEGYRRSPEFKAHVTASRLPEYWRRHGFPPQCKPVGKDDFECE